MNVGWIGLGKLGLPCAVALNVVGGHDVVGYDVSDEPADHLAARGVPYLEENLQELLDAHSTYVVDSIESVVAASDVVFVAAQTPHNPLYDGTRPAPETRKDFEYGFLVNAVRETCAAARRLERHVTVVVVSTVLPGTFNTHLRPLANRFVTLVYNPFFIAMGTTVNDFVRPEFVLVGSDDPDGDGVLKLRDVYAEVHDRPVHVVSIESAELTKVAYNVFLSSKIAFANFVGEVCDKTGADADEVTSGLALATDRITSPKYMSAGMGDGGGCHPRDLIALSKLADKLDLSYDYAQALMDAREGHSAWLASVVADWADLTRLPITVLGKAYKPESNLTLGSPAALLVHQLKEQGRQVRHWDPHVDEQHEEPPRMRQIYFVATRHADLAAYDFYAGSVVIDPFGIVPDRADLTVVYPGRKRR